MAQTSLLRPEGLVQSPAFTHVAVVPPGATTVYIGGQNAVDGDGTLVGGDDVAAQTQQVMKNLHVALAAAGASVQDLVMMTVLYVDGVDLSAAYPVAAAELAGATPPVVRHASGWARGAWCADRGQHGRGYSFLEKDPFQLNRTSGICHGHHVVSNVCSGRWNERPQIGTRGVGHRGRRTSPSRPVGRRPGGVGDMSLVCSRSERLRRISTFEDRAGPHHFGYPSLTTFLKHRCRMASGRAHRLVARSRVFRTARTTFRAWTAGRLSTDQASVLLEQAVNLAGSVR